MLESTTSIRGYTHNPNPSIATSTCHPTKDSDIMKMKSSHHPSLPPMYRSSDQTAMFNLPSASSSFQQTHLSQQQTNKSFDQRSSNHQKRRSRNDDDSGNFLRHGGEGSININVKSTNKELISSKEYENNLGDCERKPVFPEFNQEESIDLEDYEAKVRRASESPKNNPVSSRQANHPIQNDPFTQKTNKMVKRVESKWLQDQNDQQQKPEQSEDQFLPQNNTLFTTDQDVQKLSQLLNEIQLKNDTKTIKKLNTTNQQLKSVCKEIISLLRNVRNDSKNEKRQTYDQLMVKQICKIIANYEKKKTSREK